MDLFSIWYKEGSRLLEADPNDRLASYQVPMFQGERLRKRPTSTIVPKGVGHSRSVQDGRMDATQGHLAHVNAFEMSASQGVGADPFQPTEKCPKKQNEARFVEFPKW